MAAITVRELRQHLARCPDDAIVLVEQSTELDHWWDSDIKVGVTTARQWLHDDTEWQINNRYRGRAIVERAAVVIGHWYHDDPVERIGAPLPDVDVTAKSTGLMRRP